MEKPVKQCTSCGLDLNGQKRVKDPQGNYFCPACWDARVKGSQPSNAKPKAAAGEVPVPQRLRAVAEQLVKQFSEGNVAHLKFDLEGVRWVDGYINRNRKNFPVGQREGLVSYLGAFVGECIMAIYGGAWQLADHGVWGVKATEHVWCDPRSKVEKQFDEGQSQSVASFVELISTLEDHLARGVAPPPQFKIRDPRTIPRPN